MGFWDFINTAIIVEGVDHILHSKDNKKPHNGYDPGAWRRDIDKENDNYRRLYSDEDNFYLSLSLMRPCFDGIAIK